MPLNATTPSKISGENPDVPCPMPPPIYKFISNHAKILLKEIKDRKINRRKKNLLKTMTIHNVSPIRVCSSCLIIIYNDFKQLLCLNICKTQ